MTHTRLWVAATIIAGIILVGFILSVPHTRDISSQARLEEATTTVPDVSLRDVFKKGVHTLTGSIDAPNPCTTLSAAASLVGSASSTQSILVALSMPVDTGTCLQQVTSLTFSTTIVAPAHMPLTATVNGSPATVTAL